MLILCLSYLITTVPHISEVSAKKGLFYFKKLVPVIEKPFGIQD